jgi:hypothetical protein
MKTNSNLIRIACVAALVILADGKGNGFTANALPVATVDAGQPFAPQTIRWEEEKVEKLRHAYYLLEHADGDYAGHRVAAMRSIKKAAEILGVEIRGGGHAEEAQWNSDRKLHEAKHILEDLQDQTGGKEQAHVHRAVKELDKALVTR